MFGSSFVRSNGSTTSTPPSHFKDSARNAIYQQLPVVNNNLQTPSIRSAPSIQQHKHQSFKSSNSSVFSKRSARSAPSIYSSSTATIPEDSEPIGITIEQLVNDVQYHENFCKEQIEIRIHEGVMRPEEVEEEQYKISLGSDLNYQNPENLLDWNLNVTRCKLLLTQLPIISSIPDFSYLPNSLPLLVGDLSQKCHLILLQPYITDKELIHILYNSNIYEEHNLDNNFKKSVAEVSVKQSRLLQINSPTKNNPIISVDNQVGLEFKYKEIAIRNYLINLAAAATTAYEYKKQSDEMKRQLRITDKKAKISKEDKKLLWDRTRSDVFRRAGLEE
ncbi:hypothetical protein CLIB1444_07S06062 [[Candida] jaroonii]|uniref:Uncharacterized protein n=1 Tax=[Candida] jaroonii TaxID=467808 RepID=A0ACA9YA61_9ASCO|nr:hypothetical protein CLIB1444_07S06062 [[Candida] jaroonii]